MTISSGPVQAIIPTSQAKPARDRTLFEVLVVWSAVTLTLAIIQRIPIIHEYSLTLVAAATLFLYVPICVLWLQKKSLSAYGITWHPLSKAIKFFLLAFALVLVPFATLYGLIFYGHLCDQLHIPISLIRCSKATVSSWLPDSFLLIVANTTFLVALPEETFFRGYLQTKLEHAFSPYLAIFMTSILFALSHLFVIGNPTTLLVFFPSLIFGLLKQRTGTIVASVLFHAACNLSMVLLHHLF